MNGDRRSHVGQILSAIDNGKLPHDEIERRLESLIEAEFEKVNEPVDTELIEECQSLLMQLHHFQSDKKAIPAFEKSKGYLKAQAKRESRHRHTLEMRIVASAAVFVLIIGGFGIHRQWLSGVSSQDGQQFLVKGHEISTTMVESAIAEHEQFAHCLTSDIEEAIDFLGFTPTIPSSLNGEWEPKGFDITFFPESIQLYIRYASKRFPDQMLIYARTFFTDVKNAFLSLEQNTKGEKIALQSTEVYMSQNSSRTIFTWQDELTVTVISGVVDKDALLNIVQELIGGKE